MFILLIIIHSALQDLHRVRRKITTTATTTTATTTTTTTAATFRRSLNRKYTALSLVLVGSLSAISVCRVTVK